MLRTGKLQSEGQSFHRKLLSEYDTNITLENYMSYFELKSIAKSAEKLRIRLEERLRENKRKAVAPTVTATKSSNNLSDESTLKEKAPDGNSTCLDDLFTPNTQEEATKLFPTDDIIAEIYSDLRTVHQNFFHIFHVSYLRVKQYLLKMEERLTASMNELRHHSDMVLREISPDYIPSLYAQVQSIVSYRTLNLYAFRKIMRKFLERCACDSIVLQRRIFVLDAMIDESSVAHPTVDLRGVALELIAIYGTVFKHSYEETVMKLQYYDHRTSARDPRLLATSDTFFFANTLPQQELPGTFMVRVIAGSGSTLAEKMLTEVLQCPQRSTAACHRFPNGEVFVKLLRAVRGDDVFVVQSMAASPRGDFSTSDVIVELSLLIQCVKLAGAARVTAVVPYLAYTRNVASIAVLAEVIETMGCNHVVTVDMHSDQVEGMFTIPLENVSAKYELIRYLSKCLKNEGHDFSNITIVAPSGDYLGRAKEFADALMRFNNLAADTQFVSVCTAAKRFQPSMWNANSSYSNVHSTTTNNNNNNNSSSHNDTNRFRNAQDDKAAATAAAAAVSVNAHEGSALVQATASDTVSSWQSPTVAGLSSLSLHAELKQGADSSPTNTAGLTESAHADKKKHNGSVLSARPATSEAVHVQTKPTKEDTSSLLASPRTLGTPIIPRAHDITPSTSLRQPSLMLTEPSQHSTTSGSNLGSPLAMASKTLGMEKALRKQAAGREAVLQQIISTVEDEGNDIVIVGEAHNRLCIILDTMIGEAENLSAVVRALRAYGAQRIFLVSTHAVLCGRARELLIELPIELIIVTDTVNLDHEMYDPRLARKLRVVPIAPLLALAIEKIHTENTLSTLFEK